MVSRAAGPARRLVREAKRPRYEEIRCGDGGVYLRRWRLWRGRFFSVYVHWVLRPDAGRCPHDHPWSFWSLVLWGWYVEEVLALDGVGVRRRFLSLAHRTAYHVHRIVDVSRGGAVTLVVMGSRLRRWGFIGEGGRWVPHDERDPEGECPSGTVEG